MGYGWQTTAPCETLSGDERPPSVWLNYPFRVVLWRCLCRTIRRAITREELFSGNRESFRKSFLSRDSIILWAVTSHRRVWREYRRIFDDGDFPHLRVIELREPAQARALLASLGRLSGAKSATADDAAGCGC